MDNKRDLGPFVRIADYARAKKLSIETVEDLIHRGELIGIVADDHNFALPTYQFISGGNLLPWLSETFSRFDSSRSDHVQFSRWMLEPSEDLDGKTPVAMLRSGLFSPVLYLAAKIGAIRAVRS